MKAKMSHRLVRYFIVVLAVFILLMTAGFYVINQRAVLAGQEAAMTKQVQDLADTLGDIENQENMNPSEHIGRQHNNSGSKKGYRHYLNHLDQVSPYEVWVVDREANQITIGNTKRAIAIDTLPPEAETFMDDVFAGNTVESRSFSSLAGEGVITIGAPVYDRAGAVLYAVLVHEQITVLEESNKRVVWLLLVSSLWAVLVAMLLSFWLSRHFVTPLDKMVDATTRMARGDFTARTQIQQEDEIGQLAEHIDHLAIGLAQAEEERRAAEENRRDFIAGISHELKTPVTVMRASLEGIQDDVLTDPATIRNHIALMLAEARQLDRFISDLLDLTNLQNPGFSLQKESVMVRDVLMDAIRSQRQIAQRSAITVQVDCQTEPVWCTGDYSRLRQLFGIILANAVTYSPPNGEVSVRCHWQAPRFTVQIQDHGCGMTETEMAHIFDRFYRGEDKGKAIPGSGIGLAVAKEIAERHNATITVSSLVGEGSTFVITLPAYTMSRPLNDASPGRNNPSL